VEDKEDSSDPPAYQRSFSLRLRSDGRRFRQSAIARLSPIRFRDPLRTRESKSFENRSSTKRLSFLRFYRFSAAAPVLEATWVPEARTFFWRRYQLRWHRNCCPHCPEVRNVAEQMGFARLMIAVNRVSGMVARTSRRVPGCQRCSKHIANCAHPHTSGRS